MKAHIFLLLAMLPAHALSETSEEEQTETCGPAKAFNLWQQIGDAANNLHRIGAQTRADSNPRAPGLILAMEQGIAMAHASSKAPPPVVDAAANFIGCGNWHSDSEG